MEVVYEYPHCPFREVTHTVVRHVPGLRKAAAVLWPAAQRAEWVHIDSLGIEAAGLASHIHIAWDDVSRTSLARSPLGRQTFVVTDGSGQRIVVASTLPEFGEMLERIEAEARVNETVPLARAA